MDVYPATVSTMQNDNPVARGLDHVKKKPNPFSLLTIFTVVPR
jgi:hypothetical protein